MVGITRSKVIFLLPAAAEDVGKTDGNMISNGKCCTWSCVLAKGRATVVLRQTSGSSDPGDDSKVITQVMTQLRLLTAAVTSVEEAVDSFVPCMVGRQEALVNTWPFWNWTGGKAGDSALARLGNWMCRRCSLPW